jgi:hypothetical protein
VIFEAIIIMAQVRRDDFRLLAKPFQRYQRSDPGFCVAHTAKTTNHRSIFTVTITLLI